jgi:hypothetical protein
MAMTGRFDANFESFHAAVSQAVIELKGFDAATGQVASSMNKMVDTFSGRQIWTQAEIMTAAIEKIGGASYLTASELQRVGTVAAEAAEKFKAWGQDVPENIQKYADAAKNAQGSTNDWGQSLAAFNGVLSAFGVSFSIGAIVAFAKETAEAAEQLDKLHTRTGIGIEALERFHTVGDAAGNTLEQISAAAVTLSERLASGNKSTKGALEDLGISVEAFRRLSMEDQLKTIAAALQEIPDPARQVAEAYELMGQKGVAILPTLKSDIEGIGTATHVMSEASVKDWAAISTAMKSTGAGAKAYAGEWALALLNYLPPAALTLDLVKFYQSLGALKGEVKGIVDAMPKTNPWGALLPPEIPGDLENIQRELDNTTNRMITNEKEAEGWSKIFEEIHKTTFQLAMEHEKTWRVEGEKEMAARNKSVVDGLTQTRDAFGKYFDFLDKTTLDSTDYQIKKIWEKADADKLAFKGTAEQAASYYKAIDALADAETRKVQADADAKVTVATNTGAAIVKVEQDTTKLTLAELKKREDAAKATYDAAYTDAKTSQDKINALDLAWQEAHNAVTDKIAATSTGAADTIGKAYQTHFEAAQGSFEQFAGVVVAGTADMIAGLATFNAAHDAGSYVATQTAMRDAQNQRGQFYIDTGIAGLPTRDSGGPVVAGSSYLIGGGKAPELFTPGASGFVTPGGVLGGGGSGINLTVHVTQPFGTPEAIARAVADAQIALLRGQGVRLPYGQ